MKIITAALLFFIPTITYAETLFVNGANPAAKDTNSGTHESPWLTIQRGVDQAKPGDVVVVMPGNYGRTSIRKKGEKNGWIVVKGTSVPDKSHVDKNLKINPEKPFAFQGNPAANAVVQGFDIVGASYIRVENFEITAVGNGTGGVFLKNSDNIEIVKNFLHDLNPEKLKHGGIRCDTHDVMKVLIKDNTLFRCAGTSITTMGENWIVEGNEASHGTNINTATGEFVGGEDAMRIFGKGHMIRGNYFHDFWEDEQHPKNPAPHLDAFQTFSVNPQTQYASDITIEKNYCADIGQMFMGSDTDEKKTGISRVHNFIIRNNIFLRARAVALIVGRGCDHFTIVNNVVADSQYSGLTITDGSHHATVVNNIFFNTCRVGAAKGRAPGPVGIDPSSQPGSTVDYNLCNYTFTYPVRIPEFDKNSLFGVDPKFVDPEGGDFRLQKGSPAIGAASVNYGNQPDLGASPFGGMEDEWILKRLKPSPRP